MALELWSDIQSLGWGAASALATLTLQGADAGDMLMRLRAIAREVRKIEEQAIRDASKGGRG